MVAALHDVTKLDDLPMLVVETILEHLDLGAIKSLRLANSRMEMKCFGPHFKSFIHAKTDLSEESLQSLLALATNPKIAAVIKRLTIVATVYDDKALNSVLKAIFVENKQRSREGSSPEPRTKEHYDQTQADLWWLWAQQMKQQSTPEETTVEALASALRYFKRLTSIDLDAIIVHGRGKTVLPSDACWYPTWVRASQVYCLTMSAISRCDIAFDTLNIYRDVQRCSVPACDILFHLQRLESAVPVSSGRSLLPAGASIKNLALSISAKAFTDHGKVISARAFDRNVTVAGNKSMNSSFFAGDNFSGIARLLKHMPNLESLDLHYFSVSEEEKTFEKGLSPISNEIHLPALQNCTLCGVLVEEESMLQFLRNHPRIDHLQLYGVRLTVGSWKPILDYIESAPLKLLGVSDLVDSRGVINLWPVLIENGPANSDNSYFYRNEDGAIMMHASEFDEADLPEGFDFLSRFDRPALSLSAYNSR